MQYCHSDVTQVKVLEDYKLYLQFEDGSAGEVDISTIVPFEGVFKALEDKAFFSSVTVNPDISTISWENGADLSPSLLHEKIKSGQNSCTT